jgi:hypothetical protein
MKNNMLECAIARIQKADDYMAWAMPCSMRVCLDDAIALLITERDKLVLNNKMDID